MKTRNISLVPLQLLTWEHMPKGSVVNEVPRSIRADEKRPKPQASSFLPLHKENDLIRMLAEAQLFPPCP